MKDRNAVNHNIRKHFNELIYNTARYTEIALSIVIIIVIALSGLRLILTTAGTSIMDMDTSFFTSFLSQALSLVVGVEFVKMLCRHSAQTVVEVLLFATARQQSVRELEEYSKDFDGIYFQLALNYGSRDEIRRGMQKMAQDVKDGKVEPDGITEDTIESYLDTAGVPDPDLLIRTSGEQRLSNFLLWQLAYSEFYFTPVAWPDFNKEELIKAIEKYNQRDRRYGGVKEE